MSVTRLTWKTGLLRTEEGKAILQLLDDQINPQVAAHGGHISLIDVKENTAFVRLEEVPRLLCIFGDITTGRRS